MLSTLKKINILINKRQRKGLVILTLLLFVGMVLEIIGLGILVPALTLILEENFINTYPELNEALSFLGPLDHLELVYGFLIVVVGLYFFKTVYIMFLTFKQHRFLSNLLAYIGNTLYSGYLSQPYEYHLKNNASKFIKNLQSEVTYFGTYSLSIITIVIEGSLALSVIFTLIYIEPIGAISIGLFFTFLSVIFFQFTKKKLSYWGKRRELLDQKLTKIAIEGLGGIKDLNLLGRVDFFKDLYSNHNYHKARLVSNHTAISQYPRLFLEFVSILGLVGFIIIMLLQGKPISTLMATLGVFVAATFRIIPSINRIIAAAQNLKFYNSSIDSIYNDVVSFTNNDESSSKHRDTVFKSQIELDNISFSYGKTQVLKDINLKIKKGSTIGFIGQSGSGKSTLVDIIIGILRPTSGVLKIDGLILENRRSWQNNIGYVSQNIFLTDNSILMNVAFGIPKSKIDVKAVIDALKKAQLLEYVDSLPEKLETTIGERGVQLSGGQRQRIGIARALYHNPSVLVLDEATASLDSETEKEVMDSIHSFKGEKTIIIIAHRLSTLDFCDKLYKIENNEIFE